MIAQFNCTGDWVFYLEGDEIIHEKDYSLICKAMEDNLERTEVEALVFDYYHFYGTPDQYVYSPKWYRKAPRILRNTIRSWAPDGLFWLIMDKNRQGRYPNSINIGCHLYHYGHVRSVAKMNEKMKRVEVYWSGKAGSFAGYGNVDLSTIVPFNFTHPSIVQKWLDLEAEHNFVVNPHYKLSVRDKKHRMMSRIEKIFRGLDLSKKQYKLIKHK